MIADAVDTAVTLGWALCVWIVLMAAVGALVVWTVLVTAWCAVRATVRGVLAARSLLYARLAAEQASEAPPVPQARKRRPTPSWTHEQPIAYEEAV